MSIIAQAVKHMLAAGMTAEAVVAAIADMEASVDTRTPRQKRNARHYESKTSEKRLKASETSDCPSPPSSPLPVSPKPPSDQPPYNPPIPVSEAIASSCPKPKSASVLFDFEAGVFSNISDQKMAAWAAAYPAIDIRAEIRRAAVWLIANPANRKSNYLRFINSWLCRAQDKAPANGTRSHPTKTERAQAAVMRAAERLGFADH